MVENKNNKDKQNKINFKELDPFIVKIALLGEKGSGKTTLIKTFKEYAAETTSNIISNGKYDGTLLFIDKKEVFLVEFIEINDFDRDFGKLKCSNCLFICSFLDKKERLDKIINIMKCIDKKNRVEIFILGNIPEIEKCYFSKIKDVKDDFEEPLKDYKDLLNTKEFFPLKFNCKEEVGKVIQDVILGLEKSVLDSNACKSCSFQ